MKNAKHWTKGIRCLLAICLLITLPMGALAETVTDKHGNPVELDATRQATSSVTLVGADGASRQGETNLGDFWTDALRWFAVSGKIDQYFDEDDVLSGNDAIAVDEAHVVALWNGGNLRADIPAGDVTDETLAAVLPYPNQVAVVYMTGEELLTALEASSQGLPYTEESASACAALMQVAGLNYAVNTDVAYDAGEAYGEHWFKANSVSRVSVQDVNGQPLDADALYAVITSNANYNGMDASYVFAEAVAKEEKSAITTAAVRDVIWMYIEEVLSNEIGAEYESAQGRIAIQAAR